MKHPLLWLVILGFVAWWALPFGTYGLFGDGVFYSCISRNWAFSEDPNWWHMVVTPTLDAQFNGHPPMALWLEGGLFKLLGDYFWIEHLYGLIMAILSGIAIFKIWERLASNYHQATYTSESAYLDKSLLDDQKERLASNYPQVPYASESAYLPLIFWMLMPIIGWSYMNNMLENTLCALTLWAVYCLIPIKGKSNYRQVVLGGVLIFMATLTKGPVGLYPLAVVGWHWLVFREERFIVAFLKTLYLVLFLIGAYYVLISFSEHAKAYFIRYFELQLRRSLAGENLVTSRWVLFEKMATEPLIALAIIALAWLVVRFKSIAVEGLFLKGLWFYGLLTVSVVAPMLISPKQLPFYIVPALPYLSLAFAVLFLPIWTRFAPTFNTQKWLSPMLKTGVAIGLVIMVVRWGSIGRDRKTLHDVFYMTQTIAPNDTIGIQGNLFEEWDLHCYLYRIGYISLFTVPKDYNHCLRLPDESFSDTLNYTCTPLERYKLYSKKVLK